MSMLVIILNTARTDLTRNGTLAKIKCIFRETEQWASFKNLYTMQKMLHGIITVSI